MNSLSFAVNHEEWVPLGTFWSLDWDSPDDVLEATVTARVEAIEKAKQFEGLIPQV